MAGTPHSGPSFDQPSDNPIPPALRPQEPPYTPGPAPDGTDGSPVGGLIPGTNGDGGRGEETPPVSQEAEDVARSVDPTLGDAVSDVRDAVGSE